MKCLLTIKAELWGKACPERSDGEEETWGVVCTLMLIRAAMKAKKEGDPLKTNKGGGNGVGRLS